MYRGACSTLRGGRAYAMSSRVLAHSANALLARNGPYLLRTSVNASLAALQPTPHAFPIGSSPAFGNMDLFCGDIRQL
jgi:hypothetical protein